MTNLKSLLTVTPFTPDQWGQASETDTPTYQPPHLTRVSHVEKDGKVTLNVVVYLPQSYGAAPQQTDPPPSPEQWSVQVRLNRGPWQTLQPPQPGQDFWSLEMQDLVPGTSVQYRFRNSQGKWQPILPLNNLDNVYATSYVPDLTYQWKHPWPKFDHAKVLVETTFEGLLAGYKGGKFAPQSLEEMFQSSIARRILRTDIPRRLSEWAVDEVMSPVSSSVADRSHLDPKFNYLTYNVVDLDWQIGNSYDFMELLDTFHRYGILVVPDLVFAHQVQSPFPGSLDQVRRGDGEALMVDSQAFLFRDYGTWMFKLSDANVRQMLIEKIAAFVDKFKLHMIRIDYIDGLILQYCNREHNFAEEFIRDLKQELHRVNPRHVALGETFEVASNPAVQSFIDVFYAPVGFTIVEELYKPPSKMERPLYPNVKHLAYELNRDAQSPRKEAVYAQLHDETWYCQHIVAGRPYVPWAYGGNPAELARRQGEELIQMGLLSREELLNYVRQTVRNAEALTMFVARLRYMFVPTVDSLALGCLDDEGGWKVIWEGIPPHHLLQWKDTGLSEAEIFRVHAQHRTDMIRLRQIFRHYTKVDAESHQPLVYPYVNHVDPEGSLLSLFRVNPTFPGDSLLILFNFGPNCFQGSFFYELPVPTDFNGRWQVLFDADWMDHPPPDASSYSPGYPSGTELETQPGEYSNQAQVLRLRVGASSLVVLKYDDL